MSNKTTNNQKKLSKKEQRRLQVAKEKRNKNLKIIIPVVAFIAVLATVFLWRSLQPEVDGTITVASAPGNNHDDSLTFAGGGLPPMGGPHNTSWLNCGIYDVEVPTENAIHSMEHGAVWVTYDPEQVDGTQIASLQDAVRGNNQTILSPYPNQDAPIVMTTWDRQLVLDSESDLRFEEFMSRYRGKRGPEAGTSCSGGVGNPIG